MAARVAVIAFLATSSAVQATQQHAIAAAAANPIRKVVTMLQKMQKTVEAEGQKEKSMYDKYMCWCKNGGGALENSIASANTKMPQVASEIEEAQSQAAQLKEDLKTAQADRSAAKAAMAEATALREKEQGAFAAEKSEADTNIAAMDKAITALEKGSAGAFVQTGGAESLRNLLSKAQDIQEEDRQEVLAFLSGKQGEDYAPQSGSITGLLKQMRDTFGNGRAKAIDEENAAIKGYKGLMAAKNKEVEALTAAIESKTVRSGELAVEIVQMKNDLSETEAALMEDSAFLKNLEQDCKTKAAEWDEVCKTRGEEQVALSETIKILNDDDALELFKKTLPSASASFVQVRESDAAVREQALAILRRVPRATTHLDFISLALQGKKVGFGKVIKMIDDMVALLKQEQTDDESKKEYCNVQLDSLDDKKKSLERSVSDLETAIAEAEDNIATLKSDIKLLGAGIAELDKSVAEATEQRKDENEEYKELMASDAAAKEVLGFAKNRLNKFYNPKLYKAPAKRELSEEERITVNNGGTLAPTAAPGGIAGTGVTAFAAVSAHVQQTDAPPPPPEAVGAYQKKGEESTGVIAMIDLLVKDLDKELTEAETTEKDAQGDYEQLMKDAADKRAGDSKALVEKESARADAAANLQTHKDDKASTGKELMATLQVIQSTHNECDWLLQYFDVRKEARSGEIDSLTNAKAVLSGADFSLLQTKTRSLRGQ